MCFQEMVLHTQKVCVCVFAIVLNRPTSVLSVAFRFVVFRPFTNEVLVGKIRSCSAEGVRGKPVAVSQH